MKTPIVAFAGPENVGKSTSARYLEEKHNFRRLSFADPLKNMLRALGVPEKHLTGTQAEKNEPLHVLCGKSARQAMRFLGTEWGRGMIGNDIWTRNMEMRIERSQEEHPTCGVVIDDCRFDNEAWFLISIGAMVYELARPGIKYSNAHASDTGLSLECVSNTVDITQPGALDLIAHDCVRQLFDSR